MLQSRSNLKARANIYSNLERVAVTTQWNSRCPRRCRPKHPVSGGATQILAHMPIAQEFTPSEAILVAVDMVFRFTTETGADIITVNIRKGTITSPVLATTSQVVAACHTGVTCLVHFEFPAPLLVNPGDKYIIEVRATKPIHAWQSDGVEIILEEQLLSRGLSFPMQTLFSNVLSIGHRGTHRHQARQPPE
jgi:hypothetical protein